MNRKRSVMVCCLVLTLASTLAILNITIVGAVDSVTPDFSSVTSPPYPLTSYSGNPVLTASMVTDRQASFVADPFLFHDNNMWYMFFEVMSPAHGEEIGVATSGDGFHWAYQQIVLSDPQIRFSFPQVYKCNGNYYMVPDSCNPNSERLYTTTNFPYGWTYVSALVSGKAFADPSLFYYNGMWWMFVADQTNSNCYLYYSPSITASGWTQHPKSPIVVNDVSRARPAGRTILYNNGIILRFVQKCDVRYGEKVRAFQVDTLTTTSFAEHEIPESPLVAASGSGWNSFGMHTFDLWWTGGNWLASTDGDNNVAWSIGIYTTASTPQTVPQTIPQPIPANGQVIVFGNNAIGATENWWGGQFDVCKFQWSNPTGTYSGNITVYLSHAASAPNNKMTVGIYDATLNKIVGSVEKTGLTVGWNTQSLTGTFTLTNEVWYWLYVHSSSGSNGRMASSSVAGQHGWGDKTYDGSLPNTLSLAGTEQTVCSVYASLTSVDGSSISSEYSLTVNTQPVSGLTIMVSNSSFTQKMLGGPAVDLEAGTYTIALPNSLTLHYDESPDVTWLFSAWSDGITTNPRQIMLDKDTVLSAIYTIQGSTT